MHTAKKTFIVGILLALAFATAYSYPSGSALSSRTRSTTSCLSATRMGNLNSNTSTKHATKSSPASVSDPKDTNLPLHTFRSPFLPLSSNEHEGTLPKTKTLNALIILNSPIQNPPSPIFTKLWNISSIKICADGGANRLHCATATAIGTESGSATVDVNAYIPDLITGDLDSLHSNVRSYYEERGVNVERDGDQDCNDLDKALSAIRKLVLKRQDHNQLQEEQDSDAPIETIQIYVYGAFGGRFDQEMASIQALYKWKDEFDYRIALYNDETCAMLLRPYARNEIYLPFHSKCMDKINSSDSSDISDTKENRVESAARIGEGPTCGLIPIGCLCEGVETEGFKWNLDGSVPLEFGGLVSTSNRAEDSVLVIRCQQPLVFTAEILQP
jgi:thiamine pyrophosphokinase